MIENKILIGIAKGKIYNSVKKNLIRSNIFSIEELNKFESSRKLLLESKKDNIILSIARPKDLLYFFYKNIIDLMILGSDMIDEIVNKNKIKEVDLNLSKCRLSLISKNNFDYIKYINSCVPSVASKYVKTTKKFFLDKFKKKILFLNLIGTIELSLIFNTTKIIVDIVSSSETLRENNLIELDIIKNVSCKLIALKNTLKKNPIILKKFEYLFSSLKEC